MERLALVVMIVGCFMKSGAARLRKWRWTGLSGSDKLSFVAGRSGVAGGANLFAKSHNNHFVTIRELMESRGIQLFN